MSFTASMPYKDNNSPEAKASMARRNARYYAKNRGKEIEIITPKEKKCSKCKKTKPSSSFYERKDRRCGLSSWCDECLTNYSTKYKERNRIKRRLRMFGVDEEMYNKMLSDQNHQCAICGVHEDKLGYTLCVDHDHITGDVRGLLCHDCNVGIGRFKDNQETLKNAVKYLTIIVNYHNLLI